MMPTSTQYITKLSELKGATFFGKLYYEDDKDNPDSLGFWAIKGSSGQIDNLVEWLDRFEGKVVRLSIETTEKDEAHLLPPDGAPAGPEAEQPRQEAPDER